MIVDTSTRTLDGGITVFAIRGRLNLGNALMSIEHALEDLIQSGVRKLIVDVAELERIDSAGIGMLISSSGRMEAAGGHMRIAGANGVVKESFAIVHMDRVVQVDPDVESAQSALDSGQARATAG